MHFDRTTELRVDSELVPELDIQLPVRGR